MILIIAEKPSLGRNIVDGIHSFSSGKMVKNGNYFEGNGYIVTWAFGHLFSLSDVEDYQARPADPAVKVRWTMENLPCFPNEFKYNLRAGRDKQPDAGIKRQFELIRSLCNRPDVDTIVNAGDSDREGEIIIRTCVQHSLVAGANKHFTRLWLPDQTTQTIAKSLNNMKPESDYDNLANEGFARTYIDWLYGVNLTRYATLKTGSLLRVGRVIIPIVKAIYDRDMAIKNFVPDKYYAIVSKAVTNGEEIELASKQKFTKNELAMANALCEKYNSVQTTVTCVKNKKDTLQPGKLYSLSKLQNVLGKRYKISMSDSLAILQKLYEEGYVTYPRTNSEYLAIAEKDKISQIVSTVKNIGYPVEFKDKKTIFDDSKIESHSALTPTFKIPSKGSLSEDEMKVYSTIIRRFVAVFCSENAVINRSEITVDVGGLEQFALKGSVIIEPGWTKYDDYNQKDKILPKLKKGDVVNTDFMPVEKETSPPKRYTIETLNNYLKNPFREEKSAAAEAMSAVDSSTNDGNEAGDKDKMEAEEYKAIFEGLELGTEATRTGIIDNAKSSGYIQLKKDTYTILSDGEYLIRSLSRMNIIMDKYKTAELGKALKKVYRGEISISDSVDLAKHEIKEIFQMSVPPAVDRVPIEEDTYDGYYGDIAGVCPVCKSGNVMRTKFGYSCQNYKNGCKFSISSQICSRTISISNVKLLCETKRTSKIRGFISKTGNPFDAVMKVENDKCIFDFS